ncbi:hypothetical protein MMC25_004545 [Agyrium rufum]|nr:hypothetical protein [Agyrium rufum]
MTCRHISSTDLRPPTPAQSVYRDDCTQCFDSIDDPAGLDVCLSCFNGGCPGDRQHARYHSQTFQHPLVLNIKRIRKKIHRDEPPQKMSKLAISAETDEDRYETKTHVKCYECGVDDVDATSGNLQTVIQGVLKANTFARQAEVKAWEQEMVPCEHTLCLQQGTTKKIESQDLGHCSSCDLKENLWLCLQCGNLGCGRAQFGGVGGNSHGLHHADSTSHTVAVKLGSITPEGTADVYCYSCNEERADTELTAHLANWGINIAEREKTEKSLTEMQIEQNLRWEFSMTTEDGKELKPLFGEGFTGLKNLGNSCYLASILQCLFSLPEFRKRYYLPNEGPVSTSQPAEDVETQLRKMADGLLSGRYSCPDTDVIASPETPEVPHQKGLAPAMLKHLIGRGHEEFSTMRQQDAFELLLHFLKLVSRSTHPPQLPNPVKSFRFTMQQRLQCLNCKKVRYRSDEQDNISIAVPVRRITRSSDSTTAVDPTASSKVSEEKEVFEPVTLKECFDVFTAPETVDLTCSSCTSKSGFTKRNSFASFPQTLAINARRFELVNWVPTKLDIPVIVSETKPLDLTPYFSSGLQDGEELLPEDSTGAAATNTFQPNEAALAQLEAMGFPRPRCEKALYNTGNADAEAAMNWLFGHMDDPDIDDPIVLPGASASGGGIGSGAAGRQVSEESIEMMSAMGIAAPQARKALKETGGDVERAVDWVFSHPDDQGDFREGDTSTAAVSGAEDMAVEKEEVGSAELPAKFKLKSIVCHKGGSIHAGHYVAFIRKDVPTDDEKGIEESWVLFNDEKVVKAGSDVDEMLKTAYVYFFERS